MTLYAQFETEIPVQPRDVDMNGHVHHSVYLDYLLTARFDQMTRCYKMSIEAFNKMGFTWITRRYQIEYRSELLLNDTAVVRTWLSKLGKVSVDVAFEIESQQKAIVAARGLAKYVLIDIRTHKPIPIPRNIVDKYSIPRREKNV